VRGSELPNMNYLLLQELAELYNSFGAAAVHFLAGIFTGFTLLLLFQRRARLDRINKAPRYGVSLTSRCSVA
jgi:hypothetical protein